MLVAADLASIITRTLVNACCPRASCARGAVLPQTFVSLLKKFGAWAGGWLVESEQIIRAEGTRPS